MTQLRRTLPNSITFPQKLREAIPALEPCAGRVLELDSVDARSTDSGWTGRRVGVKLRVCKTGKLDGAFDVWIDLNPAAAKVFDQFGDSYHNPEIPEAVMFKENSPYWAIMVTVTELHAGSGAADLPCPQSRS